MALDIALCIYLLSGFFKIVFYPAYKSTDFEVHRNWLAITNSLPISKWYYEDTSQWTLDYPPFFAWFEYILSQVAAIVDPGIVSVGNLNYSSWSCVVFQRLSVIATEIVLCVAVILHFKWHSKQEDNNLAKVTISLQLLCNFGLFIVDHIHFQYNGFLFGILLLSVSLMLKGRHLESAVLFAILLNLKHIFLYIAPAYFVYLLKHYCFTTPVSKTTNKVLRPSSLRQLNLIKFFILGDLVIFIFMLSFGPFILMGQLGQVIGRLFPVKRGLCHAYWAPNIWALYNVVDKFLTILLPRIGLSGLVSVNGSMTSGLVGEMTHQVLPGVSPLVTVTMTLITMAPPLFKLWYYPSSPRDFLRVLILCGYSSFLFGWHVHEKAILMITLPMSYLAIEDRLVMRVYLVLSFAGHISLFPLLFTSPETLIKILAFISFTSLSFATLPSHTSKEESKVKKTGSFTHYFRLPGITLADSVLLAILLAVQVYCIAIHNLGGFMGNLPFLPLLLTSISCAVVVVWTWVIMLQSYGTTVNIKDKPE